MKLSATPEEIKLERLNFVMNKKYSPLINIVICTYNAEAYIKECLQSIAMQRDLHVRVWIIDGASGDSTLTIVEEFRQYIHYIQSKPDNGVYDAMNRATDLIKEGWILFLGADDRLMPNALQCLRYQWQNVPEDASVVYGDVYRPSMNVLYDGRFSKWLLVRRNICQQAILYNVNVFQSHSFDTQFRINADHVLNLILSLSRVRFAYLPVCIAYYEDVADGISRDRGDRGFIAYRRKLTWEYRDFTLFLFACLIDVKQKIRVNAFKLVRLLK
jgi:glycosyltransferase involved in cell wall biosynthesis